MSDDIIEKCVWAQDDWDCDVWATDCGKHFSIIEGTPTENSFRFCCYCGKPIEEAPYEEPKYD